MSAKFLEWTDPFAWTERLTPRTKQAIRVENALFKRTVSDSGTKRELNEKQAEFQKVLSKYRNIETIQIPSEGDVRVLIETDISDDRLIRWRSPPKHGAWTTATSIDVSDDGAFTVAYTVDTVEPYDYRLHVKTASKQWTHPHGGGPFVAIQGDRVYYLEGDRHLQYTRLISLSLSDGHGRKIIYEETDPSVKLSLIRGENRCLFLIGDAAGRQTLAVIDGEGICRRIGEKAICFYPVGFKQTKTATPIYFARIGSFDAPWTLFGANWILNADIKADGIEFCSAILQILVTKSYGIRTIWRLSETVEPKQLYRGLFEVLPYSTWPLWREEVTTSIPLWIRSPVTGIYSILCNSEIIDVNRKVPTYAQVHIGKSISADGILVRWALLKDKASTKAKGLMLVAYGAYGTATTLNTVRWIPWLRAGWAVALLFVRGGGDGNEMWADLGRLGHKADAVQDVEACCRHLQDITGTGATNTCLFGRSAGGLLVGNLISRNPHGFLFSMVYAETPYVDLLKTASNPGLPLTAYEYDEFGNPAKGPAEFEQTLNISPIHTLGPRGAPGVNVLCRSGYADIQVFYYESLKWIYTLRGTEDDPTKILYINQQSHHTYGKEFCLDLAEDFLVIQHWLEEDAP